MSAAADTFWQEYDDYHDLAERFERSIEITHPDSLGGRSGHYGCGCSWCASEVTYYQHTGSHL